MAEVDDVSLILLGNGPAHAELQRQINASGASKRIRIVSGAADEQRNALLAQADALVLPSQERTEAFGVVLLEAMRWAKPVIVADIPGSGAPWLVRSSDSGIVVPTGAWDQLTEAIRLLKDDPELRQSLGTNGREALAGRFSIGAAVASIDAIYDEARSA